MRVSEHLTQYLEVVPLLSKIGGASMVIFWLMLAGESLAFQRASDKVVAVPQAHIKYLETPEGVQVLLRNGERVWLAGLLNQVRVMDDIALLEVQTGTQTSVLIVRGAYQSVIPGISVAELTSVSPEDNRATAGYNIGHNEHQTDVYDLVTGQLIETHSP